MKLKIIGEGHTFCNVLRKKLHKDSKVTTAAYNIEHPLIAEPVVYVETVEDDSPKDALVRAAGDLSEEYEEFGQKLEKALEQ